MTSLKPSLPGGHAGIVKDTRQDLDFLKNSKVYTPLYMFGYSNLHTSPKPI